MNSLNRTKATDRTAGRRPLELWGGPECTIVRIGDHWRDQAAQTGHRSRLLDIDLIASLGIKTVRYPFLWESVAPDRPDICDFAWTDERLARLEAHGVEVIAGLVHHGSGPHYTNLLDPDFGRKLGDYAGRVAERYPHIKCWAPVNEPLTTARFSALYGHWYPHRRDYRAFLRAVVNQCQGIRAAMAAIRAVNPEARLIQTEDLGRIFSTPMLAGQAEHENERRWLSLDLLAGRVDGGHPFHRPLIDAGIGAPELEAFADGASRPDLIGLDYYLTSDRFLDHRIDAYPGEAAGGNGRVSYVDVDAVRVASLADEVGVGPRIREIWDRYAIPLAITEVHHGCTREQQLRWFDEVWSTAQEVRAEGVDLRAVTLWSMFGAVDWRSLLTREEGTYDVGAVDIRAPGPRPTAVAKAAAAFAKGEPYHHPVLGDGWWKRPERLFQWCAGESGPPPKGPPLLITGAAGTLGQAFARIAAHRGLAFHLARRADLDIGDERAIAALIGRVKPWAIVNAAGFVRVADAEQEIEACMAANAYGAANLARACRAAGIPLLSFSSDLVFDGLRGRACAETDPVNPAGTYGNSKAVAERLISAIGGNALIVRTSAFFGAWDRYNFAWSVIEALRRGVPMRASASEIVSPTFVPDLCHAALDLLIDGETGIWHLANQGALSWHAFARAIAQEAGLDAQLILASETGPARNTALVSERGALLRPLENALADYVRDVSSMAEEVSPALSNPHSAASIIAS